jgi:hypothetical protein
VYQGLGALEAWIGGIKSRVQPPIETTHEPLAFPAILGVNDFFGELASQAMRFVRRRLCWRRCSEVDR